MVTRVEAVGWVMHCGSGLDGRPGCGFVISLSSQHQPLKVDLKQSESEASFCSVSLVLKSVGYFLR